jgi:hypothetical protein
LFFAPSEKRIGYGSMALLLNEECGRCHNRPAMRIALLNFWKEELVFREPIPALKAMSGGMWDGTGLFLRKPRNTSHFLT